MNQSLCRARAIPGMAGSQPGFSKTKGTCRCLILKYFEAILKELVCFRVCLAVSFISKTKKGKELEQLWKLT